jgi:hypothetical protein
MRDLAKAVFASAAAALVAAAVPANAATFVYSYTFDTGDTATGSFTGTGPISAITDISNVSLSINGKAIAGVAAYFYNGYTGPTGSNCPSGCIVPGPATVSSDPLKENFMFSNSDLSQYFYIIPWNNSGDNQVATQAVGPNGVIDSFNGQYIPANFSVSAVTEVTPVPEASTWAMMLLGFGIVGFAVRKGSRVRTTVKFA